MLLSSWSLSCDRVDCNVGMRLLCENSNNNNTTSNYNITPTTAGLTAINYNNNDNENDVNNKKTATATTTTVRTLRLTPLSTSSCTATSCVQHGESQLTISDELSRGRRQGCSASCDGRGRRRHCFVVVVVLTLTLRRRSPWSHKRFRSPRNIRKTKRKQKYKTLIITLHPAQVNIYVLLLLKICIQAK